MKAMILAAGRGERLRPLTDSIPKPLLEVKQKPLIVYHLEALSRAGFKQVVVNISWLGNQIRERLGDGDEFNLQIEYSEESEALETAGGIRHALDQLSERFIVLNADIYTDYDFSCLKHIDADAHLVLVENPRHHPQGDFTLQNSKIGNQKERRYTFAGISQYHRRFFDGLEQGKQSLAPLLRRGADLQQVSGELYRGSWIDIGTIERWQSLDKADF